MDDIDKERDDFNEFIQRAVRNGTMGLAEAIFWLFVGAACFAVKRHNQQRQKIESVK